MAACCSSAERESWTEQDVLPRHLHLLWLLQGSSIFLGGHFLPAALEKDYWSIVPDLVIAREGWVYGRERREEIQSSQ